MRSMAHFKGHPIHPMLVGFPIAFVTGALAFDAAGRFLDWRSGWTTGAYLSVAAVVTGLAAAVPGLIDYLFVVPPNSSAKSRATWHMLVNVGVLGAVAAGWLFRDGDTLRPGDGTLLLETAGVALVTWGGWMGGTLAYRNQIGVDHRYAGAGRYQVETVEARAGGPIVVARVGDLDVDQMKLLRIDGRRIVLARTVDGYAAFDDRCTHSGGSLAGGVLVQGTVQCPWHGSQFEVRDGSVKAGPAQAPVGTYRVETAGDEVRLYL
ncbi:MAG: DUF2231 domain-containing protein [Isosphaeraceae bacterium]